MFSDQLQESIELLPLLPDKFSSKIIPVESAYNGTYRFTAAFSPGCLMDIMFSEINLKTIDLLNKNGIKVITPASQNCCGSLHAHNGEMKMAMKLAKRNIDLFSKYKFDYFISNSAGCGAFMKEYGYILMDVPEYKTKAEEFSSKVKDISEIMADINLPAGMSKLNKKYTYHDACHLIHSQKISKQPRDIINQHSLNNYIELKEASWCCGSAGIYNITRHSDSNKFLERKMINIRDSKADIVVTSNPGCIAQIKYGAKKYNMDIEVLHLVEYLTPVPDQYYDSIKR